MGHWNFRICKNTNRGPDYEEVSYQIREAYYNEDGGIWAVTEDAKGVYGEDIEDVKDCLAKMQLSLNKEIIDLDTFVFAIADFETESGDELPD